MHLCLDPFRAFELVGDLERHVVLGATHLGVEGGQILHEHQQVLRHLHRDDVTGSELHQLAQGELGLQQLGPQLHLDVHDLVAQGLAPAHVGVALVALDTGIQQLADGLQHGVGHGDVEVATAAVQLDVERAHYDHLGGTDDVGHGRVHLGVEVLEAHVHHRRPGILVILKDQLEQHLDDASLGRGELAPLDLGMVTTIAAEEVLHQDEDQTRLHGDERRALEGTKAHHVETGRHEQGVDILAEFQHLHAVDGDLGGTAHHVEQADPHMAGETLVHQLKGRHPATDDAVLGGEVKLGDTGIPRRPYLFLFDIIDTVQEGINFVLT